MTLKTGYFWVIPAVVLVLWAADARAQAPAEVVVVVNDTSALSRTVGEYYARARAIPAEQVCRIRTREVEEISREVYDREIEAAVAGWLVQHGMVERALVLVTTAGVPLRISGGGGMTATAASVDSELAALYGKLKGGRKSLAGPLANPYYASRRKAFSHPECPIYIVARLAGYRFEDIRAMVDRAPKAENRGRVVLDMKSGGYGDGEDWLRRAARKLPPDRVVLEESSKVVSGVKNVIGYAGWGSNDSHRKSRVVDLGWLPGGVATEFVSTNGRTFAEPPAGWNIGPWGLPIGFWAGSPQSLTADWIRAGATAATGHVYEPYLSFTPRPEELFLAYVVEGRTLGDSYSRSIPAIGWMNILVGDPLCRLRPVNSLGGR
jgi:uncharacterized protein (TIGR03790 family)